MEKFGDSMIVLAQRPPAIPPQARQPKKVTKEYAKWPIESKFF
jgi:hypothetical protein